MGNSYDDFIMQENCCQEVLSDVGRKGRERPWKPKKVSAIHTGTLLRHADGASPAIVQRGVRMTFCSEVLAFNVEESGKKRLKAADFCKGRLCPMCEWRRSMKVAKQVSDVLDVAQERKYVPIFLTLTIENMQAGGLTMAVDEMMKGWKRLTDHRSWKKVVKGYFRAMEITIGKDGSWHPHFHAILMVDRQYFRSGDYLTTKDWVHMWRTSMRLDYDPVCDIRKIRGGTRKAVAEVAKYVAKEADWLKKDPDEAKEYLLELAHALQGRRLVAFGGVLYQIAKELKQQDAEDDDVDLVHVDEDSMRDDVAQLIEVYRWNFGSCQYLRDRRLFGER